MKRLACLLDSGHGRLGNQLLRLAATIGLAERYGVEPMFERDWRYRHVWSLPDHWYGDREELSEHPTPADLPDTEHLGYYRQYLQDRSLWADSQVTVRKVLVPSPEAMAALDSLAWSLVGPNYNVTAVHVRRGDNVTNECGTINALPRDYYLRGLAKLAEEWDVTRVLVVTDDVRWCERHLGSRIPGCVIHGGVTSLKEQDPGYAEQAPTDWLDLLLLASCLRHVISNSTFAYMGAFLGADYFAVRPSYWVGPKLLDLGFRPDLLFTGEPWWSVIETEPEPC